MAELVTRDQWGLAPDPDMRKRKRAMEEELLIKFGATTELIELHPMILASRLGRAKPYASFHYNRVNPPAKEIIPHSRNPWLVNDPALRQIDQLTRSGPRDIILPSLANSRGQIRIHDLPLVDKDYHSRRTTANERLTELFGEWTAYHQSAYQTPIRRKSHLRHLHNTRTTPSSTLVHTAKGRMRHESSSSTNLSKKSQAGDTRPVPKSHKKKNRWKDTVREVTFHIHAARMKLPRKMPKSELRLYVSSTPDVQEEREFLEEVAYPKIQELCERLGLNCHVVDMRNGSGTLANDIETFDIIKQELNKCRKLSIGPYFVSIIGHKLDDQRLPGFLHKSVYEEIRQTLIQENIPGLEALDNVYRLDSNQVPPLYIKQPIHAAEEYQSPEEVERTLYSALDLAVSVISKRKGNGTGADFYNWSAVVKEIEEGMFTNFTPRSNLLCFMMDSDEVKEKHQENMTPIQQLRHRIVQHYKDYAHVDNIFNLKSGKKSVAYLRSISDNFVSSVVSLLKSQIHLQEYDITQMFTEGSEVVQHVSIALHESENNSGNDNVLSSIKDIVDRSDISPRTILLWGQSGTGKSVIVSQVAKASTQWQPQRKVVFRCLGRTLRSSSLFRLLESLLRQVSFLYSLDFDLPNDQSLQKAVSLFCNMLHAISSKRESYGDLLLILDQLEQLPDMETHYLMSILNSLSAGTTLILTLQTPHHLFSHLESNQTVKAVTRLCISKKDTSKHIKENLNEINHQLTDDQLLAALNALPSDITPLHSQLLFHLSRWWPSHTLPELKQFSERPDLDFCVFLETIETELGKTFTRYALSFLAVARHGLANQELLHLLSKDSDLLNEIKEEQEIVSIVDGFPYQYQISRLISRLGKFVISLKLEGETVYQIMVRPLVDAITTKYLCDGFIFIVHSRLAKFFIFIRRGLLLSSKDISEQKHKHLSKYHWRTLRCVPYHLCHSSADTTYVWAQLKEKVFFNFAWLVNEVYSGYFNDLMEDIGYALENVSLDPDVQYLQKLLTTARCTITHNPLSFAAILASQNVEDLHNVKGNIKTVVNDARTWLQQVHLQALVPVSYTQEKTKRLMIEENSFSHVTSLRPIPGTDKLLILRKKSLFTFHMLTSEEVLIATLQSSVISVHLPDQESVVVLTLDTSSSVYMVDIFNLHMCKHVKSITLGSSCILWFDVRSAKASYFAVNFSIKFLDLVRGSVKNVLSTKTEWTSSSLSSSKPEKVLTVTTGEITKIEAISVQDIMDANSITLKNEPLNHYCTPLLSTKDGRYLVYVTERQAVVIDQSIYKVKDTYTHNGLPIVKAEFSRSHEHVFLAYVSGAISCHILHSGKQTMFTKIKPKWSSKILDKAECRNTSTPQKDDNTETIVELVTSEDDHFLFCGTNCGHIYVFHVPTGLQIVDITTLHQSLDKIIYITSKGYFQHLITMDEAGMVHHWNMRPLLKQARNILQKYITDKDLLKEEETKLDLSEYYMVYETKRNNRIFLNGPDIPAFYQVSSDEIFSELMHLDPAFGVQDDWETTGKLADICDHLISLICGNELGGIILTVSKEYQLAKWNLHNGSLIWNRKLPHQGDKILHIACVYYDQAVLLVEKCGFTCRVSIIYIGEGQSKIMSRDEVAEYHTSSERTQILLICSDVRQKTEPKLYLWNLVTMKEEKLELEHPLPNLHSQTGSVVTTCFSPDLHSCVNMITQGDKVIKLKNAWPLKYTSSRLQEVDHLLPSGSDLDNSETRSDDSFSACDDGQQSSSHNRESISRNKVFESSSMPGSADLWKNNSHLITNNQEIPSHMQGSENYTGDTITKFENISSEKSYPRNAKTYLFWTKVSTSSIYSANAKEDHFETRKNQRKQIFFDRSNYSPKSKSTSKYDKDHHITASSSINESGNIKEDVDVSENCISVQVTAFCFVREQNILLGTSSGHLLMFNLPNLHQISLFGNNTPILTNEVTEIVLKAFPTPHKDAIIHITMSEDCKVLVSSDQAMVCLWDLQNQTLTMKIIFSNNEKISHMIIAKDAVIIAIVTNNRTIHLWTPVGHREVARYLTTFDITDLQLTCDCHKVIVQGVQQENKPILQIFDILNVDDILMHMADRKESQKHERQENLAKERKSNRQLHQNLPKKSSLNVIKENEKSYV